jgi:hypothetical protein
MYVFVENAKNSKLLALFNTLEERDKDIVLTMSKSLVERYKNNMPKIISNFVADKVKEIL